MGGFSHSDLGRIGHLGEPGIVYAGVPFNTSFIRQTCLKNGAHISVIDDWTNVFPLLNTLGEELDAWLDECGKGGT
jgi:hypothetical protein